MPFVDQISASHVSTRRKEIQTFESAFDVVAASIISLIIVLYNANIDVIDLVDVT